MGFGKSNVKIGFLPFGFGVLVLKYEERERGEGYGAYVSEAPCE